VLLLVGAARAADRALALAVSCKDGRPAGPACLPLKLPGLVPGGRATVRDAAGNRLPAQLTAAGLTAAGGSPPELHVLLPALKPGEAIRLRVALHGDAPAGAECFSWHDTPGEFDELRLGDKPVLRYVYRAYDDSTQEKREETYKVFHHLFDPAGARLVTKGAGGLYPHHRGLFFGFRKTTYGDGQEVDTWHCTGDTHQAHERVLAREAGEFLGRHRVRIGWHGKGKELFAREDRELTVYNVPGGRLVEFASVLRPVAGTVRVDGDPQHAGFHFRADNEVAARTSKETVFVRPSGAGQPGEEWNWPQRKEQVNLPWDAMTFVLGGRRYTAAYLDRPDNPKEARFSERTYGRFGSYFVAEATPDRPLAVRYQIWLQEGEMTPADVATRAAAFTRPLDVAAKVD
jgi:hypothetical protein